ncbi:MAG: VWA domain-containing protein [Thaumarchaeota archaeon]|nr:VWA domain-containing protein [Nitrososphaerota archaeon]
MATSNTRFTYFQNNNNESTNNSSAVSDRQIKQALKIIATQTLKEKIPSLTDLQNILDSEIPSSSTIKSEHDFEQMYQVHGSDESITKHLQNLGYLKADKKWLTKKAFFEIGQKILEDAIKIVEKDTHGFHETRNIGYSNTILDTSKKLEIDDDIKHLDIPSTVLNAIQRHKRKHEVLKFPLEIDFSDFEKFEANEEVKIAIVYCIDLSSTMKYSLSSGVGTRIEAAKKALWALYVLNNKFFPNDSVYIIGFGSLASRINPSDIPYLKTFDANDNFLHYTNYQAAFRLALQILKKNGSQNKRIVMITDGQPSACFIDNELQKNQILTEKPYSNFYRPDQTTMSKIKNEKDLNLEIKNESVYLCYRYKQVDSVVDMSTLQEAKKCKKEGIEIDTIMVNDEPELLNYVESLEKHLQGRAYYINPEKIDQVLINDFISNKKKAVYSRTG